MSHAICAEQSFKEISHTSGKQIDLSSLCVGENYAAGTDYPTAIPRALKLRWLGH